MKSTANVGWIKLCGAFSAGLFLLTFTTAAVNVAQNPGFESGTSPWTGFGASLSASTAQKHSGTYSGYVSGRNSGTWNGVAQSFMGVMQPGTQYTLSAWVRLASGGNQSANLTIRKTDGAGTMYQYVGGTTATSTGWAQMSGSYTLNVTGTLTELLLYMEGPPTNVNFYADDFVVDAPVTSPVGAIDATVTHQTIEGFGGAIAFYNNWVAAHPYKQEIYTNAFKGLNLGILRLGNWFRYQGTVNFDPDTKDIVTNANRILGRQVPIQMSSWSPPAFLKSNGTVGNGGTLIKINGVFAYTNFANYWFDSLMWYKTNGIVPTHISIQNEPDWAAGYDSCVFHPTEDTVNGTNYASYALALDATYQRLTNMPAPPKILAPEVLGIGYNDVQNYAATMNSNSFYGVAHHLYHGGSPSSADSFIGAMQGLTNVFPGKPKFQTEYGEADMIQTALLMHDSLTIEEVSSYIYWSLVWPFSGGLVVQEFPWDPSSWTNAPPGTPTQSHGYWLTPQYYAMKHFSYFITPGFRRVETPGSDPNARLSAYLSADNSRLVMVMINPNSTAYAVTNTLNGFSYSTSAAYQTVGTNAQTSQFASLGSAPANLQWNLPGYSITTVVFDAPPAVAGPASNPNPANGAYNVSTAANLSWTAGSNATTHRIYFGYGSNAVAVATTNSTEYKGSSPNASFTPATMVSSGRYFWRIDEMAGTNATAGSTWTFATAINPDNAPQASGQLTSSNAFITSFSSYQGQAYRVERSDSLTVPSWQPVADAIPGTDNLVQIIDTNTPFAAQRFYRLLLLAP